MKMRRQSQELVGLLLDALGLALLRLVEGQQLDLVGGLWVLLLVLLLGPCLFLRVDLPPGEGSLESEAGKLVVQQPGWAGHFHALGSHF